jgi:hypothetical protein
LDLSVNLNPLLLILSVLFSCAMSPRTLIMVTATLLAVTIVIGAGLSFKINNVIAQMMQPGMMGMGPGMMTGNMTSGMMQPGMMGSGMMGMAWVMG